MKRIIAETPNGTPVEITGIASQTGKVEVTASDNIFHKHDPWPYKSRYGVVQLDWLKNIHIEQDPFGPGDCQPEIEVEYDEYQEWKDMTSQLRRGDA
jgi:hypothetical protein